jgi:alpha-methylacyl-CoA racemase
MEKLLAALEGTRVVAVATNIPAPLAAARLAAFGARVVKVEPPHGDPLARAAPDWYAQIHANIEVIALDLRSSADRDALNRRLEQSDLLLTAMRAAALERAGLDWERLQARNPALSHVAVVGEAPPNGDRAGHDLTYQARAGLLSPPAMPRTLVADMAAAERTVTAALAALHAAARTGAGCRAEVAIVDAAVEFAAPLRYGLTAPGGALGGGLPVYDLYRSNDGWVAIAALEEHFAARLREVLGHDRLDREALTAAFAQRSCAQWERLAALHDIPLAVAREHAPG